MSILLAMSLFVAHAAKPAEEDKLRLRWRKKVERCEAKLVLAEGRWVEVCEIPDDDRRRRRALESLIGKRARHDRARARLDALGTPGREVPVHFATNRTFDGDALGTVDGSTLVYGIATVWIPPDHPVGELGDEVSVLSVQTLTAEAWHASLSESAADRHLLTYVHGYNNGFEYAARRVAQVATDVGTDPLPVLFSWPSHGATWFSTAKYTFDENAAARSATPFALFLGSLLSEHPQPVDLVAHSMGSRVVSDGLVDLHRHGGLSRSLDQLVLAAPDIDATVFAQRYHQTALAAAERVTVYCADDDRALKLSRKVHGGYDRLGSCRQGSIAPLAHPRFDVVDASQLYVDLIDHDKVTSSPRRLSDLALVLDATPIEERALEPEGARYRLPP